MTDVEIPDSVTAISDCAFSSCYYLTSVAIPDSITSIGEGAFYECDSLETVIYCGTQAQWDAIDIENFNENLAEATLQFHNYQGGTCTICGDTDGPVIIEKVKAPTLTKSGETLSWNAVTNADAYEVYRATSKSGKYTKVATVTEPTWQDDAAGKTYYYKVKAIYTADTDKNSGYSSVVSIDYKCEAPVITVANGDTGKPVISWEKVSGTKKYTVYRATSETGKYSKLKTVKTLSYTDTKATVGTTYFYKVIANASSSKNSSGYSSIKNVTAICAAPAVKLSVDSSGKPVLSWAKVTGAVKYEVYLLGGEDYVLLGTVTGTSFTDENCAPGEGRYYGVRAIAEKNGCDSEVSEPILGRGAHATPKATGKAGATGKPEITWGEVEGATRYVIYRSTSKTKNFKVIGESETLSYTDTTASKGKTYYYKVVAVSEDAESAQSDAVKVKSK